MRKLAFTITILIGISLSLGSTVVARSPLAPHSQDNGGVLVLDSSANRFDGIVYAFVSWDPTKENTHTLILLNKLSSVDAHFEIDFNQGTITGSFEDSIYEEEDDPGSYDSSEVSGTVTNGWVKWDPDQGVWLYGGEVDIEVSLDIRNKVGSVTNNEETTIYYGDAKQKTHITGHIKGASGTYKDMSHHGDLTDKEFRVVFEGRDLPSEGAGELDFLEVTLYVWSDTIDDTLIPPDPGGVATTVEPLSETEEPLSETEEPTTTQEVQTTEEPEPANVEDEQLINQLVELLIRGELDSLDQLPSWATLSEVQQQNLIRIIKRLEQIADEYIPPSQQALLDQIEVDKLRDLNRQEQLANMLEEELETRQNIQDMIWRETLKERFGDDALYLYDRYGIFKDVKGLYGQAQGLWNAVLDPDGASIDKIKQDALSSLGAEKSPEEAYQAGITLINKLATAPAIIHYAYYRQEYDQLIADKKPAAEAHQTAMDKMRTRLASLPGDNAVDSGALTEKVWNTGFNELAKPGGIYERSFIALNIYASPEVSP